MQSNNSEKQLVRIIVADVVKGGQVIANDLKQDV